MDNRQECLEGLRIQVKGIVQGVGFRPFVYSQAIKNNLTGWVRNTSSGVDIVINGPVNALQAFMIELQNNPPPLARIDRITQESCPVETAKGFLILESHTEEGQFIPISPDVAVCADCRKELFDPQNQRFRYPFINCTNCGPRFTIIQDIPYDRPKTTMAQFEMCPRCKSEYEEPLDRRFHAQPIACPTCGPQLEFILQGQVLEKKEEALQMARAWLKNGKILAIKGLGGFHLACDATNKEAVTELRKRKKRSDKPFALMAFDTQTILKHCLISSAEHDALTSHQQPIVLLKKGSLSNIVEECAPQQDHMGFMLPYTPLHLLLLEPEVDFPEVLVMTSGNLSEEPVAFQDEDAMQRLQGIADAIFDA